MLLCSSGVFVEATRYYLLEIGLLVWLLATYLLVAKYLQGPSSTKAAGIGAVITAGLLTKPNFVIYTFPVGLLLLYGIVVRARTTRSALPEIIKHVLVVTIPALVLALPWYAINLLNPHNLLITLRRVRPFGELNPVYDPMAMLRLAGRPSRNSFRRSSTSRLPLSQPLSLRPVLPLDGRRLAPRPSRRATVPPCSFPVTSYI